jgi:hypothetical protein
MTTAISNWTDSDAYPKWGKSSLRRFAWEFLRRNPEYQSDWDKYLSICRSVLPHYDPRIELSQSDYDKLEYSPDHQHFEPPRLGQESEDEWRSRVKTGRITALPIWYARKWGLKNTIYDPHYPYDSSFPHPNFIHTPSTVHILTENWPGFREGGSIYTLHPKTGIGFDMSLPIDLQIEAARKYLLGHQQYLIKNDVVKPFPNSVPRKEWVVYLRLLDADATGAKPKEIAAQLYPEEEDVYPDYIPQKKVRTALKQAKKWRDKWYLLIPSLQPPKKK